MAPDTALPATALIVMPASNTTLMPELATLMPGFPTQIAARVVRPPRPLTADDIPEYGDATVAAAAPYTHTHPSVVVYGCTAAGFLAGAAGNQAIVDRLAQQTGAPVVSTAGAMIEALRHSGARRVAVLTPYLKDVNDGLVAYVQAAGIEVGVLDSFLCPTMDALCAVTADEVEARALAMDVSGCDALFIACSQLPTLPVLDSLRDRLGIPVWSSISATAWQAERMRPIARAA